MTRRRRITARVRFAAALAAVLIAHAAFGPGIEALRARVLGAVPWPSVGKAPAEPAGAAALRSGVDSWREARARQLAAAGRVAVPVLFFRPADGIAIIGAGSESGLSVRDPVEVPAGLLGIIDAVESRLSRVRLLSARKSRIAVTLAESRRGLPGELATLNGILEGTGEGGRLVAGSLLPEFAAGDRLATLAGADGLADRSMPVGAVERPGPDPAVRLFAGPGDLGLVTVAASRAPAEPLFSEGVLDVRAAPLVGGAGALLAGAGSDRVAAGCAVHAGGRYLGRITLAAGSAVVASRLADRGHRLLVRCLAAENRVFAAELVALGGGRFRLDGEVPEAPAACLAVTAGGQDLVPADLAVGLLERAEDEWVIRDATARWPARASVSVFTAGAELKKLLGP